MNNLVWFRNDLRVEDNTSLFEATKNSGKTIGLYCFDPRHFAETKYGFKKTEKFRAKFLIESIQELKNNLAQKNITLLVYFGEPENVIEKIVKKYEVSAIFLQKGLLPFRV